MAGTPVVEQKTTAYHSSKSEQAAFASLWEKFVQYAQSKIPHFTVDATNRPVLEAVLTYFVGGTLCDKRGINSHKGLLLLGPVGCGKTAIMQLFASQRFQLVATRDIVRKFIKDGNPVLEHFGAQSFRKKHLGYGPVVQYDQPITWCFDDLGVVRPVYAETTARYRSA